MFKNLNNQKGAIHLLLIVAVVGVVSFLVLSSSVPLKDKFLAAIFPKQASEAANGPWVSAYYAGYFWDWVSQQEAIDSVDMSTMTHFVFARYAPGAGSLGGSAGQVIEGAGSGHQMVEDQLIAKAHANNVKAIMMMGGEGDGAGWQASTANSTVRTNFIRNILDKAEQKNYDGVDIDWEENLDTTSQQNQAIAFLQELRTAAGQRARYQSPNSPFIITFPGYGLNINTDLPVPQWKVSIANLVDQYNLMTYAQFFDCCGWETWFWAALKDASGSHPTSIESSVQGYVDAGVSRSKIGIGLGFYGGGYGPPVTGPRQQPSQMWGDFNDLGNTYAELYQAGLLSDSNYHFDQVAQTGYYSYSPARTYNGRSVSYLITEDLQSILAKGSWVRAGNAGGAIVWMINYGYVNSNVGNPPMQAVKQGFLDPNATPLPSPTPTLPGSTSTPAPTIAPSATPTPTSTPTTGPCTSDQWKAEYFSNMDWVGIPVLTQCEAGPPNFDWGNGSPFANIPVDDFSVRWIGTPSFGAGSTTFTTVSDDGIRVSVDGVVIINNLTQHAPTTNNASINLTAGVHTVLVEFFEANGGAQAKLSWLGSSPASKPGDINNDGSVGVGDLSYLLSRWGTTDPQANLDNTGSVGVGDLSILLSNWG